MNEQFSKEILDAHNAKRAMHGVPPLVTSRELTILSTQWANKLAREDKFEHNPNNKYSEIIYSRFAADPKDPVTGTEVVDRWYSEIKNYNFDREPSENKSWRFAQVVWKSTKELGAARAQTNRGNYIVVANYNPPGNKQGQFTQNVFPRIGFSHTNLPHSSRSSPCGEVCKTPPPRTPPPRTPPPKTPPPKTPPPN